MAPRLTISSSAVERWEKDWEKTKLSWLFSGITGARWLPPFLLPKVNRICITPNYHLCLPHPNPLNPHTDQALFDLHRSSCSCETEAQAFSFHILFLKSVLLSIFFISSQAVHKPIDAPYAAESWVGRRASEHRQRWNRRNWYFSTIACGWRWKSFPVSTSLEESLLLLKIFTCKSLVNTSQTKSKCWTLEDCAMFSTYKIHNSIRWKW